MNKILKPMTAAVGEIISNGVLFDLKNWGKISIFNSDNLRDVVERLFISLSERKIAYLLVGGVALLSYIKGRNTQEINLILAREDLEFLPEITIADENKDFVCGQTEIQAIASEIQAKIQRLYTSQDRFGLEGNEGN